MDFKNIKKKTQILILIMVLIQAVAISQVKAEPPDPLVAVYNSIAPGMSSEELTALFKAAGIGQKFQPLYSGDHISLFLMGEDILQENKIPSSSVVIRVKDQRVICVFYGFHYGEGRFIEKWHKGPCPKVVEI